MIPVNIQCTCGQRYAFDIEPVCGRMPGRVACPVCGMDGTRVANEIIAFSLASEMAGEFARHGAGREIVMACAVIGCLIAGLAGVIKALNLAGGFDVSLCLLGATLAFGLALCVYFWKR